MEQGHPLLLQQEHQSEQEQPPSQGRQRRRKNVCLFGISADPPTGTAGHVGIVQQLISYLQCNNDKQNEKDNDNDNTTNTSPQEEQQVEEKLGIKNSNDHEDEDDNVVPYLPHMDEIRILPVYRHTFVEKRDRLVSFEHRLEMCRRSFGHLSSSSSLPSSNQRPVVVVVSDDEYQSWKYAAAAAATNHQSSSSSTNDPTTTTHNAVGTAALLDYLHYNEPETTFYFCLGADSFLSLLQGQWKASARVHAHLQGRFIVVNRIMMNHHPDDNDKNNSNDNNNNDSAVAVAKPTPQQNNEQDTSLQSLVQSVQGARLLPPNPLLGNVSSSHVRALLQNPIQRKALLRRATATTTTKLFSTAADPTTKDDDHHDDHPNKDHLDDDAYNNKERWILPSVLEYIEEHQLYQSVVE
ncbi:hypothetical protein ACA910_008635 [Epithemia clementina (nom. ined.)]